MRAIRIFLWALVGIAAVGFGYLLLNRTNQAPAPQALSIGSPFTLTDSNDQRFSSDKLKDRPHAIFFGFTHCPDVCPTTLARLTKLRRDLAKGDNAFDIVLISVDPERDTAAELANYVRAFASPVTALTGSTEEIAAVTKSFGIHAEKVPDQSGGYTVDHSSQVLLFNRDGSFAGTITFEESNEVALQKLRNIANS